MTLTAEQRVAFNNMLNQFKELVPNVQINKQPQTSQAILLEFEDTFQINTNNIFNTVLIEKTKITNDILEKWKTTYNIFLIHKGKVEEINHIQVSNRVYLGDDKFNKGEYVKEANPCGFASLFI